MRRRPSYDLLSQLDAGRNIHHSSGGWTGDTQSDGGGGGSSQPPSIDRLSGGGGFVGGWGSARGEAATGHLRHIPLYEDTDADATESLLGSTSKRE